MNVSVEEKTGGMIGLDVLQTLNAACLVQVTQMKTAGENSGYRYTMVRFYN